MTEQEYKPGMVLYGAGKEGNVGVYFSILNAESAFRKSIDNGDFDEFYSYIRSQGDKELIFYENPVTKKVLVLPIEELCSQRAPNERISDLQRERRTLVERLNALDNFLKTSVERVKQE